MRVVVVESGAVVADRADVARSLWSRSKGLLGRKGLESGEGLLIEPCSGIHTFGMQFPIDAVFLDRGLSVVHLVRKMAPMRLSRYLFSARSVLELPAGAIDEAGLLVGDRLALED